MVGGVGIQTEQPSSKRSRQNEMAGRYEGWLPSSQVEKYLHTRYGPILGNALWRMLKAGDIFKDWRAQQDLRPNRSSAVEKEEFARLSAIKGEPSTPCAHIVCCLHLRHASHISLKIGCIL